MGIGTGLRPSFSALTRFPLDLGFVAGDLVFAPLVVFDFDFAAAFRTLARRLHRLETLWPLVDHDLDHLRNDLARLLDDYGVADADVFTANFAQVVERCVLHRGAGDEHRLHVGTRRELAALADLPVDREQLRDSLFGRVLVCDAPAGKSAGVAKAFLQIVAVDANDHAVDAIRQLRRVLLRNSE